MIENTPAGVPACQYDDYVEKFTKPWNDYVFERILIEAKNMATFP